MCPALAALFAHAPATTAHQVPSYVISVGYVLVDTYDKGKKAYNVRRCAPVPDSAGSPDQPARSRTKPSLKPTSIRVPLRQCWTRSSGRVWYATIESCGTAIGFTEAACGCRQALRFQDSPSTESCVQLAGMRMRFVARGFTVVAATTCCGALGSLREAGLAAQRGYAVGEAVGSNLAWAGDHPIDRSPHRPCCACRHGCLHPPASSVPR